jgi:Ca2+-binding EF-hand superfamily protein
VEYQAASVNLLRGMSFESIDWDGDGVISTNEASELPVLAEAYDRVDTDDDGLISRKEYAAAQRCC